MHSELHMCKKSFILDGIEWHVVYSIMLMSLSSGNLLNLYPRAEYMPLMNFNHE